MDKEQAESKQSQLIASVLAVARVLDEQPILAEDRLLCGVSKIKERRVPQDDIRGSEQLPEKCTCYLEDSDIMCPYCAEAHTR